MGYADAGVGIEPVSPLAEERTESNVLRSECVGLVEPSGFPENVRPDKEACPVEVVCLEKARPHASRPRLRLVHKMQIMTDIRPWGDLAAAEGLDPAVGKHDLRRNRRDVVSQAGEVRQESVYDWHAHERVVIDHEAETPSRERQCQIVVLRKTP